MAEQRYKWRSGPERMVGLATAGSKVTGSIRVYFNNGRTANVQTTHEGYQSPATDDVQVGTATVYWIHMQVDRQANGTWKLRDPRQTSQHLSRKDVIGYDTRPIPKAHHDAIVEAVERAVSDVAQPNVLAEADYAEAIQEAHRLAPELAEAESKVRQLRKALRTAERVINAYEHPGES